MESGSQDGADSPSGHVAAQRGLLAVMWLWIQDRLLVRIPGGATINFYVQNAPYGNWICAPYSAIHHGKCLPFLSLFSQGEAEAYSGDPPQQMAI